MKPLIAVVALLFAGQALAIDLDQPGALERLERDNPAHFAKVEQILRDAPEQSSASIARWMRTQFNAKDVYRSDMLKTSYPAQARLAFTLDGVSYSKTIYIEAPGKLLLTK
jgi:hypothetical protein